MLTAPHEPGNCLTLYMQTHLILLVPLRYKWKQCQWSKGALEAELLLGYPVGGMRPSHCTLLCLADVCVPAAVPCRDKDGSS